MACGNPFDAFRAATEYLGPDLYTKASFKGLFTNLIPRGTFAPNTGLTHSVFRIANQEPTDPARTGTAVSLVNGENSGACAYDFTQVEWGHIEETHSPRKLQWKGPLVCKDDQYFNHRPADFIAEYVNSIAKYVERDLENHLLHYYMRRVPIFVARSAFATEVAAVGDAATNLTAPVATSELTQQMLDELAIKLIYNRATNPDSNGWITLGDQGPLFSLGIHPTASQLIAQNNSEFRNDIRWAQSGQNTSDLMKRLGATRTLKNFRHVPMLMPPRFTHNGTAYVRVPEFEAATGITKGSGTRVSAAYMSPAAAPYEGALVLSPDVFTSEIVQPASAVGSLSWTPTNYMGDWQWLIGPQAVAAASGDACYDPLNKFGRHFAEYIHSLRPGALPEAGALVIYKRCAADLDLVQCT